MKRDLTTGSITKTMLLFALPMMIGNVLQQIYNIADTLIVGRVLGADALAAVGAAYPLMTFLTSVFLGLCMGSGVVFSIRFGEKNMERMKQSTFLSFCMIGCITLLLNLLVFMFIDPIMALLQVPAGIYPMMREYLFIVFFGIAAVFLYNFAATLLRAVGNSLVPLVFLGVSAALNIALDLLFMLCFDWGVKGAAIATVTAQWVSGAGMFAYLLIGFPELRVQKHHLRWSRAILGELAQNSVLTCMQQSIMNLGILMVQGIVNSFGATVMAAFAAAVKIDSFAYMPVQDFGNAFSTFIAQNYGARRFNRIRRGIKSAVLTALVFCLIVTSIVFAFAAPLMTLFVDPSETEIIAIGVQYLRIEGSFYFGIGFLFLLYGFYRAIKRPEMSLVLTVISLGTRVLLAYTLSRIPSIGVAGIWVSVPIGWILADLTGFLYYLPRRKTLFPVE